MGAVLRSRASPCSGRALGGEDVGGGGFSDVGARRLGIGGCSRGRPW